MKIVVNNLCKKYGDVTLFNNISFEVPHNTITCLYGKSGCGKTTLLNILGGIEKYESGSILYDGCCLGKKLKFYLKNEFGFIFQNFGLLENETVYDNFLLIQRITELKKREREKVILDALQQVGLAGYESKKVVTLSGGEQQRVAIAKMIAKDCSFIFADEPTASLDLENKLVVIELLKELKDAGKTILIVSHDEMIKQQADKIIELKKEEN